MGRLKNSRNKKLNNFNLENRLYSLRELKSLISCSRQNILYVFKVANVKPVSKKHCNISKQKVFFYNAAHINLAFKKNCIIVIPKKEKKPYFEFASVEYQSKINNHGFN